jgi:hypothetical protein
MNSIKTGISQDMKFKVFLFFALKMSHVYGLVFELWLFKHNGFTTSVDKTRYISLLIIYTRQNVVYINT